MDLRPFRPGFGPPGSRQQWIPTPGLTRKARRSRCFGRIAAADFGTMRGPFGNRYEPQHRQRVRVFVGGSWFDGAYDREEHRFWIKDPDWIELRADAVAWWTQAPPWSMADPDVAMVESRA